jgi:Baseplate J-like protein
MPTIPVTLAQLVSGVTTEEALSMQLAIAATLGLPTSAWQPVQAVSGIFNVEAQVFSDQSQTIAVIAQSGYASYASTLTNADGTPVTQPLDLISEDTYLNTRQPASYASGPVPVSNAQPTNYPYSPSSPLHFQNTTTLATYTSTGTGTVTASTTSTVNVQADLPGQGSTSGIGVVLALITPLAGVTVTALTDSLVGANPETNASLFNRDTDKLGTLGNSAPSQAASYIARTIPTAASQATAPYPFNILPYTVTGQITRCTVVGDTYSGVTNIYVANAAGAPSGADVTVITNAINFLYTGDSIAVDVLGAADETIALSATLYIRAASGISSANAITNAEDALAVYASQVPIGGVTAEQANIVPISQIIETLLGANPQTVSVVITNPIQGVLPNDPGIAENNVPVFAATITVQFV